MKLYDRRIMQHTVRDFLSLIGLNKYTPEQVDEENPSLLPEFAQVMMLLDKHGVNPLVRKMLIKLLLTNSTQLKKDSSLQLIGPELKTKIIETYRRSNERIATEYLSEIESQSFLEEYK